MNIVSSLLSECYNKTSCVTCVGTSLNPLNNNCEWCSDISICVSEKDIDTQCPGSVTECQESYYTIIFIVVVTALGCLCFGTCCLRRFRLSDEDNYFTAFLPHFVRTSSIFRNSSTECEWMCIICGFDNRAGSEFCTLCGTSRQFSADYKTEKITERRRKRLHTPRDRDRDRDIKIPAEAQISRTSVHAEDLLTQQSSLSARRRSEIFNYRRLNQLTLRQKSARRRKMWQRVHDPHSDEVRWVRCAVKDTKVGSSLFGYSPGHSFDDTYSTYSRITSSADDDNNSLKNPLLESHNNNYGNNNISKCQIIKKNKERDSFDDVVCSGSPGFTSVFGSEGELQWEKVETGKIVTTNIVAPSTNYNMNSTSRIFSPSASRLQITFNDLEAAAILTYKEKQLWFVRHLNTLQKPWNEGYVRFEVNKKNLLHDSCKCMLQLRKIDLHKWMRIHFVGSSGVDAGGLEREWFALVTAELLDPKNGLFISSSANDSTPIGIINNNDNNNNNGDNNNNNFGLFSSNNSGTFHINPLSAQFKSNHLEYFQFAGRFFGKAILEQQVLNAPLSLPLRKQLLSLPITFSDLEFVDDELYRNLCWLQTHTNVEALDFDFTVTYTYTPSQHIISSSSHSNVNSNSNSVDIISNNKSTTITVINDIENNYNLSTINNNTMNNNIPIKKVSFTKELKLNGNNIIVTDQNKEEYLQLRLRDRMLDSIKPQLEHFLRGFYEVIPGDLLSVFDYQELDLLMCGLVELDIEDWKRHTEYLGEYHNSGIKHRIIKWFWSVLESFDNEERVRLLQFTTGCSRLPPQGFKALQSNNGTYRKFNIQSIEKNDYPYPRAHTCFNKLDLPMYDSKEELEAYLSIVVSMETTGFTMD